MSQDDTGRSGGLSDKKTRRRFLQAAGLASVGALAGCSGGDGGDGGGDGGDGGDGGGDGGDGGDGGGGSTPTPEVETVVKTVEGEERTVIEERTVVKEKTAAPVSDITLARQGSRVTPVYANYLHSENTAEEFNANVGVKFYTANGIIQTQMLTGKALAGVNGLEVLAQAIKEGAPMKVYLVGNGSSDYVYLAQKDIQSVKDLEGKTIAIEGKFQNAWVYTVLPMRRAGADPDSVNFQVIGFSSSRTQAALEGEVSATPLHIDQAKRVVAERDDYHIMATINELLPNFVQTFQVATEDALQNRRDDLVKLTKAQLTANRELNQSFDVFDSLADQYQYQIPDIMSRQELHDFFVEIDTWMDNGGMTEELVNTNLDILVDDLQLLDERPATEEIVDFGIAEEALSDIGEV